MGPKTRPARGGDRAAASDFCPQPRRLRSEKYPAPIPETTQRWRPDAEITARGRPMSLGQRSEWLGQPCGGSDNIRVKASDSPTAALLVLAFAQHPSDLLLG